MKLASPLAPVVTALIATAVFIILNGYAFGGSTQRLPGTSPSSDHANVLPQVYREYDAGLFSKDPQIQSGATFKTILWPIVGTLCPPEWVNWAFFLLHIVCISASFWLVWGLVAECCGSDNTHEGGPPFAAQRMGHPGGALAGLFAMILFVVIRISPAAEPTLDTAFYTRGAALPLGLATILLVLRGRSAWAAVLLILAAAIHAITALQVVCVSFPLALISPGPLRRSRRIVILAVGMALAAAWWFFGTAGMLQALRPGAAWIAMQRAVNGSHLFVDLIPQSAWREFAVCALFLLPALAQPLGDPMRRLASAALVGAVASILFGVAAQISETSILLQLSPLRGLKLPMILSLVSAASLAVRQINLLFGTTPTRLHRISAVAGGAALLALVSRQHYAAIAAFIVLMLLGDWAKRTQVSAIVAAGAIGIWFIGVDAAHGWEQLTRTTWLIAGGLATGVVILAVWASRVGRVIDPPIRAGTGMGGPRGLGVVLASLAALGLFSIPAQRDGVWVYAARDYPWTQPFDPWAEAQRWVEKNTPVNSLVLVPPWLEGFRTYARRSEFVEYKMGTLALFHPAFGQEWATRMALLTPRPLSGDGYEDMALNYNALTLAEIAEIVYRYGITHVVVMASRDDLPYRTIHQNALLRVLDTRR